MQVRRGLNLVELELLKQGGKDLNSETAKELERRAKACFQLTVYFSLWGSRFQ